MRMLGIILSHSPSCVWVKASYWTWGLLFVRMGWAASSVGLLVCIPFLPSAGVMDVDCHPRLSCESWVSKLTFSCLWCKPYPKSHASWIPVWPWTCYVARDDLDLQILLHEPSKYWNSRPHLGLYLGRTEPRALCMLSKNSPKWAMSPGKGSLSLQPS